jgi:chromosome segregation ATPase
MTDINNIDQNSTTAEELANQALGSSATEVSAPAIDDSDASDSTDSSDEAAQSDQVAQTLSSLQNVIERNANELTRIGDELKNKRESLKNVFDNDTDLAVAEEQVQELSNQVKERRAKMQADPQVTTLKVQIGELNEQKKEIEETLSNHLVNYYQMTNSTSFDTSDGDQWEFNIRAKVKARKNSN